MSLKRNALEALAATYVKLRGKSVSQPDPSRIFVLRNNDMGDVLLATPLLHVLRNHFPKSRICVGVGHWAAAILANSSDIDELLIVDAPWHNKAICKVPWNSMAGFKRAMCYLRNSSQVALLREHNFSLGIDVLGSPYGGMLLAEANIPWRMGVHGYAGGHSTCQQTIEFDPDAQVGSFALRFATALGATVPDVARPHLYLSGEERADAAMHWAAMVKKSGKSHPLHIVVAPGAGLAEKRWPTESFAKLCQRIAAETDAAFAIVGSPEDKPMGEEIRKLVPHAVNHCGTSTLRDSFALTSQSQLVLSNSSLMMHVAAAFSINNAVLLGPAYDSAQAHASQWGYPQHCLVLGPEADQPTITTPENAFAEITAAGWLPA